MGTLQYYGTVPMHGNYDFLFVPLSALDGLPSERWPNPTILVSSTKGSVSDVQEQSLAPEGTGKQ